MTRTPNIRVLFGFAVIAVSAFWASPVAAQTPIQIGGAIPPGGGVALVTSSADATPAEVVDASEQAGCTTRSVWLGQGGSLVGYVVGAPSFVNADFPALVPAGALLLLCDGPAPVAPPTVVAPGLSCPLLPSNNIWNTRVDGLPIHAQSSSWVATIGASKNFHPDFGSGEWPPGSGAPIGIPYIEVDGAPKVSVSFGYASESDPGPYPIPANAPIEGGPNSGGDRHVLVVDRSDCTLYELFDAHPQSDGSWTAGSGAVFDLTSNELRPSGWTSADAAGLPILPGLIRYDEIAAGEIKHAIRFTAPQTQQAFVWPATHFASSLTGAEYPPMGARFRLRADFDVSGYHPDVQVILRAMQRYGLVLADNGSSWFLSGAPDPRWDNDVLRQLKELQGSDFEAIDVSGLIVSAGSGETRP